MDNKLIKVYCQNCGFSKMIFENEIVAQDFCILCGNVLFIAKEDISCPADNGEVCNKGKACDSCSDNKDLKKENDETLKELDIIDDKIFKTMSTLYAQEIREFGEQRLWDNLNFIVDLEKRIFNIEWYLEAKYRIKKEKETI